MSSGCRWPPAGSTPKALKLYSLNSCSRHVPLGSSSSSSRARRQQWQNQEQNQEQSQEQNQEQNQEQSEQVGGCPAAGNALYRGVKNAGKPYTSQQQPSRTSAATQPHASRSIARPPGWQCCINTALSRRAAPGLGHPLGHHVRREVRGLPLALQGELGALGHLVGLPRPAGSSGRGRAMSACEKVLGAYHGFKS